MPPKCCQNPTNLPEYYRNVARIPPKCCQNATNLPECYRNFAKIPPICQNVTEILPEFPQFARILPKCCQNATKMSPECHQNVAKIPPICQNITKMLPEYYQNVAKMRAFWQCGPCGTRCCSKRATREKTLCERLIAARSINPTAFDHKSIGACTHAAEIIIILKMTSQSIDDVIITVF